MRITALVVALCYLVITIEALPATVAPRCMFWFCKLKNLEADNTAAAAPTATSQPIASPTPLTDLDEIEKTNPNAKDKKCDAITKYDADWFFNNAIKTKKPKPSTCLFYTRGLSLKARGFGKLKGMTTIWVRFSASLPLCTDYILTCINTGYLARRLLQHQANHYQPSAVHNAKAQ
jgi:hypothetical protein